MDFKTAYDLDFTGSIQHDYKKLQYVPWHAYDIFMMQHFPSIEFRYTIADHRKYEIEGLGLDCYLVDRIADMYSAPMFFPIMDNKKNSDTAIDVRSLNDNIQRAYAKIVARQTGFTLRLWTREGIDSNAKNDCANPVFKGLLKLNELANANSISHGCDFSWNVEALRQRYSQLKQQVDGNIPYDPGAEKSDPSQQLSLGEPIDDSDKAELRLILEKSRNPADA